MNFRSVLHVFVEETLERLSLQTNLGSSKVNMDIIPCREERDNSANLLVFHAPKARKLCWVHI